MPHPSHYLDWATHRSGTIPVSTTRCKSRHLHLSSIHPQIRTDIPTLPDLSVNDATTTPNSAVLLRESANLHRTLGLHCATLSRSVGVDAYDETLLYLLIQIAANTLPTVSIVTRLPRRRLQEGNDAEGAVATDRS